MEKAPFPVFVFVEAKINYSLISVFALDNSQFYVIILYLEKDAKRVRKAEETTEKKVRSNTKLFPIFEAFSSYYFKYIRLRMKNMDRNQKQKKKLILIDAFIDGESAIIRSENKRRGGER